MSSVMRSSSSCGMANLDRSSCDGSAVILPSYEQSASRFKGFAEPLDLLMGVVHGKRGPAGRGGAEPGEQRHCAMSACPDRHPGAVDHRRDVMRMGALHVEGDDGSPVACSPADTP